MIEGAAIDGSTSIIDLLRPRVPWSLVQRVYPTVRVDPSS